MERAKERKEAPHIGDEKKRSLLNLPTTPIPELRTREEFNDHLAMAAENSIWEKWIAYPNLLEIPRQQTVYEL